MEASICNRIGNYAPRNGAEFSGSIRRVDVCEEAYWWCVKLVAEIGRARGNAVIEGHCFFWAGIYGLTDETLANKLGSSSPTEGEQD